ncbi:recombinase family protein [Sneathiella sp.]|uniref:recombinase family protein n=1 Tax=Sneathiella sp. TaxID=1964365 RepID=UPI0025D27741|nr:recombinase family protein [Sneathiella sp.]
MVFANSKGGVGKTTSALTIAQVLTQAGSTVSLLDADPNQPIKAWAARDPERLPASFDIVPDIGETSILDAIDEAAVRSAFVLVDLEGSANLAMSYAIGRADLVIVPMRGSQLDADQTACVISLIRHEKQAYRRVIPHAVLFTATSPAIRSLMDLLRIMDRLDKAGAGFRSLTEAIDTTTPAGRMMMQMLGSVAEFEREMVRERNLAGLAQARELGRQLGRRRALTSEQRRKAVRWMQEGQSQAEIARTFDVHRSTVSRLAADIRANTRKKC